MPGRRSPHGARRILVDRPAADTILQAPQAAVIGVDMPVTDGASVSAAVGPGLAMAIGEALLPAAVVITITPAAAAVATIIGRLLLPAAVTGRRAAHRAVGTRNYG
jgi:hypothetical protein